MEYITSKSLLIDIINLIVQKYSNRHENIFLFTTVFGGILMGDVAGASKEAIDPCRAVIIDIARKLNLPEIIINQCFSEKSLSPFRHYLEQNYKGHDSSLVAKSSNDVFIVQEY